MQESVRFVNFEYLKNVDVVAVDVSSAYIQDMDGDQLYTFAGHTI